jgi:hypothetical protein
LRAAYGSLAWVLMDKSGFYKPLLSIKLPLILLSKDLLKNITFN